MALDAVNLNPSQLLNVQALLETIARALMESTEQSDGIEAAKQAVRDIWNMLGLPQPAPC